MGEDSRVPPLSRRVPGATDSDRSTPVPRVTPRKLSASLLQRMQAAVDAAPERTLGQQQAACPERPPASPAGDDPRSSAKSAPSTSWPTPIAGQDAVTQPIPIISGSASSDTLSPAVDEISAQPEPEPEPEPEVELPPEVAPEPEPEPEVASAPAAEVDLEPEPRAGPEPAADPKPVAMPDSDLQPAIAILDSADRPVQQIGGRKERRRRRYRAAGVLVMAMILITTGSLAFALSRQRVPGGGARRASADGPATEAATRNQAAAWVGVQVSRAVTVSCDPVMCRALKASGIPAGDLLKLRPGGADPLRSEVIAATPVIRSQFGRRLSSVDAPGVIASFGSGNLRIDIRTIAQHGVAAYEAALRADLRARKASGAHLLSSGRVVVSAAAWRQLSAGQVDSRLLITIAGMAAIYPVHIVGFDDAGPGASAGSPLRSADLADTGGTLGVSASAYVRSMLAFLRTQPAPYLPAHAGTARLAGGQTVLRIEYAAPSPLGLLGPSAP
jgi:hypothetical protein